MLKRLFTWFIPGLFVLLALGTQAREVNLNTPRSCVKTHMENLQADDYNPDKAAKVFHKVDSEKARDYAIKLKEILDAKGLYIYYSQIPNQSNYRDTLTHSNTYVLFNDFPEIYLKKYGENWYYSKQTAEQIPTLHQSVFPFGINHLISFIPKSGRKQFLGLALWQYVGIGILFLLCFLVYKVSSYLVNRFIHKLLAKALGGGDANVYEKAISKALSWLVVLLVLNTFLPAIQLPVNFSYYFFITLKVLIPVLITFILFRSLDILGVYMSWMAGKTETTFDDQLVPLLRKALKVLTVIIGILFILQNLNFNITAVLTGLSIGGLAFALAAQETIKNIFGSVMIFMDKPFQVGDFVKVQQDVTGYVEEVGVRSTRVRTFDSSLITVPNGKLADMVIDNMEYRYQRHFYNTIGVTYDTPPELLQTFVDGIRSIIAEHPTTSKEEYFVGFYEMADYSLNIVIWCYFQTYYWQTEIQCREEVLLAIMRLADQMGVRFAFPTSTVHVEDFPGQEAKTPNYSGSKEDYDQQMRLYFSQNQHKES